LRDAHFGYVYSDAAINERNLGVAYGNTNNFLSEKFAIVDLAFSGTNQVNVWVYNNGNIGPQFAQIAVYDSTQSQLYATDPASQNPASSGCGTVSQPSVVTATMSGSPLTLGKTMTPITSLSSPTEITLTLPSGCSFSSGTTYYVSILGVWGDDVVTCAVR
jgi:hypothetical protein